MQILLHDKSCILKAYRPRSHFGSRGWRFRTVEDSHEINFSERKYRLCVFTCVYLKQGRVPAQYSRRSYHSCWNRSHLGCRNVFASSFGLIGLFQEPAQSWTTRHKVTPLGEGVTSCPNGSVKTFCSRSTLVSGRSLPILPGKWFRWKNWSDSRPRLSIDLMSVF